MNLYLVSITLTQQTPDGISILGRAGLFSAHSEDEAAGRAMREVTAENPRHAIPFPPAVSEISHKAREWVAANPET